MFISDSDRFQMLQESRPELVVLIGRVVAGLVDKKRIIYAKRSLVCKTFLNNNLTQSQVQS